MSVAYFLRGAGGSWGVIRIYGRAGEEVVDAGLTYDEAVALYEQKLDELRCSPPPPVQGELKL